MRKKRYRVLINGQNFLLNLSGTPKKVGFYTTRYVEAASRSDAENLAIRLIKNDSELKELVLNKNGDSPILYAEEIDEVKSSQPQPGYTFYSEEDELKGL